MTRWCCCCSNIAGAKILGFCGLAVAVFAVIGTGSGQFLVQAPNQYVHIICNYVAPAATVLWLVFLLIGAMKENTLMLAISLVIQAIGISVAIIVACVEFILSLINPERTAPNYHSVDYVPQDHVLPTSNAAVHDEDAMFLKKHLIAMLLIGMFLYLVAHIWFLLCTHGTRKDLLIQRSIGRDGNYYGEDKALRTV